MELNLAFEYHGEQHVNPDNYFNLLSPDAFSKQGERDARKLRLCEDFGVRLLVVPYFVRDKRNFVMLSLLRWFRISKVNRTTLQSGTGVSQPVYVVASSDGGSGRGRAGWLAADEVSRPSLHVCTILDPTSAPHLILYSSDMSNMNSEPQEGEPWKGCHPQSSPCSLPLLISTRLHCVLRCF